MGCTGDGIYHLAMSYVILALSFWSRALSVLDIRQAILLGTPGRVWCAMGHGPQWERQGHMIMTANSGEQLRGRDRNEL